MLRHAAIRAGRRDPLDTDRGALVAHGTGDASDPAQILQMAVAALGGALFHALGIPAAWLSGSVVAVVIWGALGQARPLPVPLAEAAMLISGASIGAAVTPEALAAMARYPSSPSSLRSAWSRSPSLPCSG